MFKRSSVIALGIIAGLSVVACGGGGGGGSAVAPGTGGTTVKPSPAASAGGGSSSQSVAVAPATFTITIPSASSSTNSTHRAKKNIASNTAAAVFTLIQTTATGATLNQPSPVYALGPGQSGCSPANGGTQCQIGVSAVVGTDVYLVDTYSSTQPSASNKVGSGAFSIVVQANQQNTASLVLSGAVSSVALFSTIPAYDGDSSGALPVPYPSPNASYPPNVYAIALDNAGNTILSPDTYTTPIKLSLYDPYGSETYGSITVNYASIDPVTTPSTVADTSGSVLVYSPEDKITVGTTLADAYASQYISRYVGVVASVNGSTASPAPGNSLLIGIIPTPATSPSPAGAIAFTGINTGPPVPTAPNPTLLGFQSAQTSYTGVASLDLGGDSAFAGSGSTIYVFFTDTDANPTFSTPVASGCAPNSTSYVGTPGGVAQASAGLFRFPISNDAGGQVFSGCTITVSDGAGSSAVLDVFLNLPSPITVDAKGRKH